MPRVNPEMRRIMVMAKLQSPPPYFNYLFEHVFGEWKNIEISRQTINNVLKNHKRNGSPYKGGKKNRNYFSFHNH